MPENFIIRASHPDKFTFRGSCDGLVCVSTNNWNADDATLVILNPMTKDFVEFSESNIRMLNNPWNIYNRVYGFGYDCLTNDYKVVKGILVNEIWQEEPGVIKEAAFNHFSSRFKEARSNRSCFSSSRFRKLSDHEACFMESHISIEEIKEAVWGCANSKAPGLDGFNFKFINTFWDIIKFEFLECIKFFKTSGHLINGCNPSFIVLIPKRKDPLGFGDYHPIISLDAFTRSWICSCLSSASISILVNGSPSKEFKLERGLQKGDPLSPLLFLIVTEALQISILKACDKGLKVNINKSRVIRVGVPANEVVSMASSLGCTHDFIPFSNLRLPLGKKIKSCSGWNRFLVEKNTLWQSVIKEFYGEDGEFDLTSCYLEVRLINGKGLVKSQACLKPKPFVRLTPMVAQELRKSCMMSSVVRYGVFGNGKTRLYMRIKVKSLKSLMKTCSLPFKESQRDGSRPEMYLFAFINHADPTKLRIGEKQIREGQVSLLESTRGRVVSLAGVNKQGNQNDNVQDVAAHVVQDKGVNIVADEEVEATAADKPQVQKKGEELMVLVPMPSPPVITAAIATTAIVGATSALVHESGTEPVQRNFRDSVSPSTAEEDVAGPLSLPMQRLLLILSIFLKRWILRLSSRHC
nr:hypothetical protein [Tanacetum cinerariifolium]